MNRDVECGEWDGVPAVSGHEPPVWGVMRKRQLAGWSGDALVGLAMVKATRMELAGGLLSELYLEGSGPAVVEAYFETWSWLRDYEERAVADALLEGTSSTAVVAMVRRLKVSRKSALKQARSPTASAWRHDALALVAAGYLAGWLRSAGVDAADIVAEVEAWGDWIMGQPRQAATKLMSVACAPSRDVGAVMALVSGDVKRAKIVRWRARNALRAV